MTAAPSRRTRILQYVKDELLLDPELGLEEHEEILASGRIDSMSVMRLVYFIRDEFAIEIPSHDLVVENFQSIEAIDRYLSRSGHA